MIRRSRRKLLTITKLIKSEVLVCVYKSRLIKEVSLESRKFSLSCR